MTESGAASMNFHGHARAAATIFILAMALMLLEVALTRIFSFITYHHMTYLVIGVAMLGFGVAGTYLSVTQETTAEIDSGTLLSRWAACFAGATLVALFCIPKIHFYEMNLYVLGDIRNVLVLFPIMVLAAAPFFFGGLCIAHILAHAGAAVNRVYFADLVGSAIGSLLCIILVNSLGALSTCVIAAALAMLAAAVAARKWRILFGALGVALALLSPVVERRGILPLTVPPGKQLFGNESGIEIVQWHSITRLDIGTPGECACSFGGSLSNGYRGAAPLTRLIFQDGSNLTAIVHPTPTPKETPVFGYYLQGAAFRLRPDAEALVIGSGGGVDVMIGLHHGARHVVAVDVNPKTMALVRGPLSGFAGNVFNSPQVEPIVSEGRHFLSRDSRKFDVIQLSGVDTWAALSSGAIALTENFIYTREAFNAYLGHLKPTGILGFSRPYVMPPLETLRLVATALDALEDTGSGQPWRNVFVLAGHGQASDVPWAELLVKRTPFTEAETQAVTKWGHDLGFDVIFDPFTKGESVFELMTRSSRESRRRLLDAYPLNVKPVTDDAPFYFQYHRWRDLFSPPMGVRIPAAMWVLLGSLIQVTLLAGLFILYPLFRRRSDVTRPGGRAGVFAYFAALGSGFILVEIALLSKLTIFLGGPAYALSITLGTLLATSGLGSLFSERLAANPLRLLRRVIPIAVGLIWAEALSLEFIMNRLMGLTLLGRALVAVFLIGSIGGVLGIPLAAGLRQLDMSRPELKPWAWGINACATVVSTAACMILATAAGFRSVLLMGGAIYVLAFLALASMPTAKESLSRQ